ncbi:MAG: cryptochrome/photolyase family protein [Merismopedia sp. SIO2A8]|nr:cryptochrome/photolyase family protein [Merismopedia sp. SIO2A8]
MTIGIWILGDQLWQGQSALARWADQLTTIPVILIESKQHVQERRYHCQKLVLVWSAMRHFAEELRAAGWPVTYAIAPDFTTPLTQWIAQEGITDLQLMAPADRPFTRFLHALELPCSLTLLPNNHFLWSTEEFEQWAKLRKRLLMESFYREGRKRYGVLMEGKDPMGGKWNLDKENRKPPKGTIQPPEPLWFEPDEITQEAIAQVKSADWQTFGEMGGERGNFGWAVTRDQALQVLDHFITVRLRGFGPYQDAMVTGQETMWHALLSPYLNLGLLQPLEVVEAVESAYHANKANKANELPLNSVEGFIRQVLGWREYMRGLYNFMDEDYSQRNWFNHHHSLPAFFWTGTTKMNCLAQTIGQIQRTGYAHHIQRLMILSNFALIAGLSPQAVEQWFHAVFIDAYDWVMQTNVIGMGLFADGGTLATKPYAASANYINRMSDYCKGCQYNPKKRTGDDACPFNMFYWDFLARHRDRLQSQGRMSFILKNLDKMPEEEYTAIRKAAQDWHSIHGN